MAFFYPKNELSIKRFYKYLPFVLYRQLPDHAQEIHDKELTRTTMFSAFFFFNKNKLLYKCSLYHTCKQLAEKAYQDKYFFLKEIVWDKQRHMSI